MGDEAKTVGQFGTSISDILELPVCIPDDTAESGSSNSSQSVYVGTKRVTIKDEPLIPRKPGEPDDIYRERMKRELGLPEQSPGESDSAFIKRYMEAVDSLPKPEQTLTLLDKAAEEGREAMSYNPEYKIEPVILETVNEILNENGIFRGDIANAKGPVGPFQGLCRDVTGTRLYLYSKDVPVEAYKILENRCPDKLEYMMLAPIGLTLQQLKAILSLEETGIDRTSYCCVEGACTTFDTRPEAISKIRFIENGAMIEDIIKILRDTDRAVDGLTKKERLDIAAKLERFGKRAINNTNAGEEGMFQGWLNFWSGVGMGALIAIPAVIGLIVQLKHRREDIQRMEMAEQRSIALTRELAKGSEEFAERLQNMSLEEMRRMNSAQANMDGSETPVEDVSVDCTSKQSEGLRYVDGKYIGGRFENMYFDFDGTLSQMIDFLFAKENVKRLGASRAGKTAAYELGLAQAYIISRMTPDERTAYFAEATKGLPQEVAGFYIKNTSANAEKIEKRMTETGRTSMIIRAFDIAKIQAKGAVFVGKMASVIMAVLTADNDAVAKGALAVEGLDEFHMLFEKHSQGDGKVGPTDGDKLKILMQVKTYLRFVLTSTASESEAASSDTAFLNRAMTQYVQTQSFEQIVTTLISKGYISSEYNVTSLDMNAARAIGLLGRRVFPDMPSSYSSGEGYLKLVLLAARDEGVKNITLDFVLDHYRNNYESTRGPANIDASNIETAMKLAQVAIDKQNAATKAEFDRVNASVSMEWYEMDPSQVCDSSSQAESNKSDLIDVAERLARDPRIAQLDISNQSDIRALADVVLKTYRELPKGSQRRHEAGAILMGERTFKGAPTSFLQDFITDVTGIPPKV